MAGNIFETQTAIEVSIIGAPSEVTTQVALEASVTNSFNTRVSQTALEISATGTFNVRITQAALEISVITCASTSYVPPAPSGLITLSATAGPVDTGTVDLSWTELTGFTYAIGRSLVSGGPYTAVASGLSVNTFQDSGLVFLTTYYYEITGTDPCGNSTVSNEASATPNCTLPDPPTGLTVAAGPEPLEATIRWTAEVNATYDLSRSASPGGEGAVVIASGLTATIYTDSGLAEGRYYYAVSAITACGTGAYSAWVAVQVTGPIRECVRLCHPDDSTIEQVDGNSLTIYAWLPFEVMVKWQPHFPNTGPDTLVVNYTDCLNQPGQFSRSVTFWGSDSGWVFLSADQQTQFLIAGVNGAFFDANAPAVNTRNTVAEAMELVACANACRYDAPVLLPNQVRPTLFIRDGVTVPPNP